MKENLQPEKVINTETVKIPEFGEVEIIPAINAMGCVDPRESTDFPEHQRELIELQSNIKRVTHHEAALRSPGGSFGYAMSLLGADSDMSPRQAVDLVKDWEKSEGRIFSYHQDDHGHGLGCGHIDKASQKENEELYGIPSEKVHAMRKYLDRKLNNGEMKAEVPVLTGYHKEKGVLVVLSDDRTVRATGGGNEFFRFDATRHDKSLNRLSGYVQSKGIAVTAEALMQSAEKQRNATLMLLGAGLPIYEVNLQAKKPTASLIGSVPTPPQRA